MLPSIFVTPHTPTIQVNYLFSDNMRSDTLGLDHKSGNSECLYVFPEKQELILSKGRIDQFILIRKLAIDYKAKGHRIWIPRSSSMESIGKLCGHANLRTKLRLNSVKVTRTPFDPSWEYALSKLFTPIWESNGSFESLLKLMDEKNMIRAMDENQRAEFVKSFNRVRRAFTSQASKWTSIVMMHYLFKEDKFPVKSNLVRAVIIRSLLSQNYYYTEMLCRDPLIWGRLTKKSRALVQAEMAEVLADEGWFTAFMLHELDLNFTRKDILSAVLKIVQNVDRELELSHKPIRTLSYLTEYYAGILDDGRFMDDFDTLQEILFHVLALPMQGKYGRVGYFPSPFADVLRLFKSHWPFIFTNVDLWKISIISSSPTMQQIIFDMIRLQEVLDGNLTNGLEIFHGIRKMIRGTKIAFREVFAGPLEFHLFLSKFLDRREHVDFSLIQNQVLQLLDIIFEKWNRSDIILWLAKHCYHRLISIIMDDSTIEFDQSTRMKLLVDVLWEDAYCFISLLLKMQPSLEEMQFLRGLPDIANNEDILILLDVYQSQVEVAADLVTWHVPDSMMCRRGLEERGEHLEDISVMCSLQLFLLQRFNIPLDQSLFEDNGESLSPEDYPLILNLFIGRHQALKGLPPTKLKIASKKLVY